MNDSKELSQNNPVNRQNLKFVISVEELSDLTPDKISNVLQNASKKKLAALHLFDLSLFNEQPLISAGGVYLFFSLDNISLKHSKNLPLQQKLKDYLGAL